MKIQHVTDAAFKRYGAIIKGVDFSEIEAAIDAMDCPAVTEYVAAYEPFEKMAAFKQVQDICWGENKVEIGYCIGHNTKLNGLEYHRSSEINLACLDIILLLGKREDIDDHYQYDTSKVEAFFVPKGTAVELYATTMHFAPCGVKENNYAFKTAVVLPYGTNFPLDGEHGTANDEDQLLFAKNKWLLVHEESGEEGAYIGLFGENICIEE